MKIIKTKPEQHIKYVEIIHHEITNEVWANFNPDILDEIREKFPSESKSVEGILKIASRHYDYLILDEFGYLEKL